MRLIARFPWGFWFTADTGEIVDLTDNLWNDGHGRVLWTDAAGQRHDVLRADPWELL